MHLCEYQSSRSFIDLGLRSLWLNVCQHFQKTSPLKHLGQFQSNFICSILTIWGSEMCSNNHGHMINMASMPIYGKNLKTSSSPKPLGWLAWNLIFSVSWLSTTKFLQMVTLCWPSPIYVTVRFGPLEYWLGKRWDIAFFQNNGNLWYESRYYMKFSECLVTNQHSDFKIIWQKGSSSQTLSRLLKQSCSLKNLTTSIGTSLSYIPI